GPLSVRLHLDPANNQLTGTVNGSTLMAGVSGGAGSLAGTYTLLLPANAANTGSAFPQGDGYATMTVTEAGTATVNGKLGDGTAFSFGGPIHGDGTLPFYVGLYTSTYPQRGSVMGTIAFRSVQGVS